MTPLYCSKCHERNTFVKINETKSGSGSSDSRSYSFGKGLLGAALLGPVGAVAGINGKKSRGPTTTTYYYQCRNCGNIETDSLTLW